MKKVSVWLLLLLSSFSLAYYKAHAEEAAKADTKIVEKSISIHQACAITYLQKKYSEAFQFCTQAAQKNDPNAQTFLGALYNDGLGVAKDSQKAADWIKKAADQNHPTAQYTLSLMYKSGQGVKKDAKTALHWLQKAADKGVMDAQLELGDRYRQGEGLKKDFKQALKWYELAAQQGNTNAQYNLALLYLKGDGVKQDNIQGFAWMDIASRYGNETAKKAIDAAKMSLKNQELIEARVLSLMTEAHLLSKPLFEKYAQKLNKPQKLK